MDEGCHSDVPARAPAEIRGAGLETAVSATANVVIPSFIHTGCVPCGLQCEILGFFVCVCPPAIFGMIPGGGGRLGEIRAL